MNKKIKSRPQPPAFTSRKAHHIETVHLCFSFKYFDPSQGQTFDDWHKDNLILPLLEKLKEYSKLSIDERNNNEQDYLYLYITGKLHGIQILSLMKMDY